jgi:hypothetical protein
VETGAAFQVPRQEVEDQLVGSSWMEMAVKTNAITMLVTRPTQQEQQWRTTTATTKMEEEEDNCDALSIQQSKFKYINFNFKETILKQQFLH